MGLLGLGGFDVLHDPVPRTAAEAVAQLTRIVGDTTDLAARAAIVTEATRVAAVAARPLDDATAVIAHVSFGVFDLPALQAWEVEASDGRIIPLTVQSGGPERRGRACRPGLRRKGLPAGGRQVPRLRKRGRHLPVAAGAAGAKRRVPPSVALPVGSQGTDLKA
ncbi:hypothetical protein C8N38_107124 [Rhodovulum kholense]|uniref:Uncharacterized protein n=2 Tax=Rhodovulum kholense TaxID=453584 RepID=A0A8E2VL88_9RHOB|nr:hypothetical protein C8N38_107124 [Rhodovulum kholense]